MTPSPKPALLESPIPEEWKRRIARELEPGEEFLWAGQPDPIMGAVRYLPRILAGMFLLLVFLISTAWWTWPEVRRGHLGWLLLLVLFLLALLALALLPLWHWKLTQKTCYALSDRRALVFLPSFFGALSLNNYFPEQLRQARFERSWWFGPQAGDWVFRQRISEKVTHYVTEGRIEVHRDVRSFGFLMLRRARELEPLLRVVAGDEAGG